MKKLDQKDEARMFALGEALDAKFAALEQAVSNFNKVKDEAFAKVINAHADYSEIVAEANQFREDIVSQIDDHMGSKSDKWLEGEKGQAYDSWKSAWSDADIDPGDIEPLDDLEVPEGPTSELFANLPTEPEIG